MVAQNKLPRKSELQVFYFENHSVLNARFAHCFPPRENSRFPDPLP